MKKILIIIFIIVLSNAFCFAKNQNKEDDYLYSEAYFDYLIECAQEDIQKQNFEPYWPDFIQKHTLNAFKHNFKSILNKK